MRVAIIGAGICGLYLGEKLREIGNQVVIFEKREKVGKIACSGLFSERLLSFVPESESLIENKIENGLIHFPNKTIRIRFSKIFLVMNHAALDNLVLGLATGAGAKVVLNRAENSEVKGFDRIIGCDGGRSSVRRGLGFRDPEFWLGIQGFVPQNDSSNFVETWPQKEGGFIWKIPRGKEVEYDIMAKPALAQNLLKKFIADNKIQIGRLASAVIPQGLVIPNSSSITLCGDAAGLTKPWSGGGVVWALTAAEILIKTFPDFLRYQKEASRFFRPRIFLSKIATKAVYFLGFNLPWILPENTKIESDFLL